MHIPASLEYTENAYDNNIHITLVFDDYEKSAILYTDRLLSMFMNLVFDYNFGQYIIIKPHKIVFKSVNGDQFVFYDQDLSDICIKACQGSISNIDYGNFRKLSYNFRKILLEKAKNMQESSKTLKI